MKENPNNWKSITAKYLFNWIKVKTIQNVKQALILSTRNWRKQMKMKVILKRHLLEKNADLFLKLLQIIVKEN